MRYSGYQIAYMFYGKYQPWGVHVCNFWVTSDNKNELWCTKVYFKIKIWLVALSFSCLIAYWFTLPGYAILGLLMWIVVILFTYLVVIPLRDGLYSPLIDQLKKLWLETFLYFLFEYWQNDPGTSFQFIKNINQFWSI